MTVDGKEVETIGRSLPIEQKLESVQNAIIGQENTLTRLTIEHGFGPREIVIMRRAPNSNQVAMPERNSQSAGVGLILDFDSEECVVRYCHSPAHYTSFPISVQNPRCQ